ncbi:hypothetical protein ACFQGA_01080 [Marinobacter koreensis]|uniref:TRAP-type C4-dicarboxylate transport system, large permease component n=1 Tax=Marinobacter koreensis TaxID=335974 RepID=A0ABW0RSZ0_9GAMM|nr:hypothetical protein [Marinobacter koreensis]MCK7548805.1 hypothetical protein [Marinobacter koreensis]
MSMALQWVLTLAVLLELLAIGSGVRTVSEIAGVLVVLAFLAALPRLNGYARFLFLLSLAALMLAGSGGYLAPEQWFKASSDAAFYAAFLGSLGMMQCLVRRFEVLRRIHDVLLGGRALWLYPKYALVSCGVASVLSFGMMSVLCGTLSETLRERGIEGGSRLIWLRSVLISALRGFALVPLVAPTSVAVAILTRELPQLSWSQLLPYGAVSALLLVLIGWFLEHRRFRQISGERMALDAWPTGTTKLLLLLIIVFTLMALLVLLTGFKVSVAAMFAVPAVTLLYMTIESGTLSVLDEAVGQVAGMANEMAIFAASAILGVALSAVIPADALHGVVDSGQGMFLLAVIGLLMLPLFSMLGVIPITVLSVQAGLLPTLVADGLDPLVIAVALVIGFSLAMMLSPFGPSVMLLSRFGQVSRWIVAFRWNGVFVLIALPALAVWTALVLVWLS